MNFARFLSPASIDLYADFSCYEEGEEEFTKKQKQQNREEVLYNIAELLDASGRVNNCSQLYKSLKNNNRKASSAIGEGIAIPHARCMQSKNLTMCFLRCMEGVDFDSPDDTKVNIFIGITAPPYDDKLYLRLYKSIAKALLETDVKDVLLDVEEPGEVIRAFNTYFI